MIKAVVTDIDGTFADGKGGISPETMAAGENARAKGVKICFASGREIESMRRFINDYSTDNFILIGCNGTVITNGTEILFEKPMSPFPAVEIVAWAEERNLHIQSFWRNHRAIPKRCARLSYHAKTAGRVFTLVDDLETMIMEVPPLKLMITDSPDRILRVRNELMERYGYELQFMRSEAYFLEIFAKGCDKGTGLRMVCEK